MARVIQAGAITMRGKKVLIVRAKKNPLDWIFPKGHVERGESLAETACRELAEEAGNDTYFYRHRFYDAAVGRFLSQDPLGFAGGDSNLYRYVGNSGPNYRDPSGLSKQETQEAEGEDLAQEASAKMSADEELYPGKVRADGSVFQGNRADGTANWEAPPPGKMWLRNPFSPNSADGAWVTDPRQLPPDDWASTGTLTEKIGKTR